FYCRQCWFLAVSLKRLNLFAPRYELFRKIDYWFGGTVTFHEGHPFQLFIIQHSLFQNRRCSIRMWVYRLINIPENGHSTVRKKPLDIFKLKWCVILCFINEQITYM